MEAGSVAKEARAARAVARAALRVRAAMLAKGTVALEVRMGWDSQESAAVMVVLAGAGAVWETAAETVAELEVTGSAMDA